MSKTDGGAAFPRVTLGGNIELHAIEGMKLRDWFAGQVLANAALAPYVDSGGWSEHTVARLAYTIADAMLKERER